MNEYSHTVVCHRTLERKVQYFVVCFVVKASLGTAELLFVVVVK